MPTKSQMVGRVEEGLCLVISYQKLAQDSRVRAPASTCLVARFIGYQHIAQVRQSTHAQQENEAILHALGRISDTATCWRSISV
ncbi:unnamed protein product, partial [Musa hybrid cultivar]